MSVYNHEYNELQHNEINILKHIQSTVKVGMQKWLIQPENSDTTSWKEVLF